MREDSYWENNAFAQVQVEPGDRFGFLLRFNGWHIERHDMEQNEARAVHLHFLRSEAAFGPMSPERQRHIEEVLCSSTR